MEIGESGIRECIACPAVRRGNEDGARHFGAEGNRIDLGVAAVRNRGEIGHLRPTRAAILALEKTLAEKIREEMVRGEGIDGYGTRTLIAQQNPCDAVAHALENVLASRKVDRSGVEEIDRECEPLPRGRSGTRQRP